MELGGQRLWRERGVEAREECREQKTKVGACLLAMVRILDFIPMKWKAFEVVGFGCILETGLGKHNAGERETSRDTIVLVQTSTQSLDPWQVGMKKSEKI